MISRLAAILAGHAKTWLAPLCVVLPLAAAAQPSSGAEGELVLKVESAALGFDQASRPAITIRFQPASARDFGSFTTRNINKTIDVVIDGNVVTSPRILTPIPAREITLSLVGPVPQMEALANRLSSGQATMLVRLKK